MATKKPSAKKSVKSASAPTTMTATLIPSKPWHSRGAVAIVLVVIIALLAAGFAVTGTVLSKKTKQLQGESAALRAEVTRLSKEAADAQQALLAAKASEVDLSKIKLEPLAHSTRSGAWYYFSPDSESPRSIYKLDSTSGKITILTQKLGPVSPASPTGRYVLTWNWEFSLGVSQAYFSIIDLDQDTVVKRFALDPQRGFCDGDSVGVEIYGVNWISPTVLSLDTCDIEGVPKSESKQIIRISIP